MFWKWCLRVFIISLGLLFILALTSHLGAEIFWFQEVGYLQTFLLRLITQSGLWVGVISISFAYLLGNLAVANRLKYPQFLKIEPARSEEKRFGRELTKFLSPQYGKVDETAKIDLGKTEIRLHWLLPLSLGLSFLVGFIVAHYGEIPLTYWYGEVNQVSLLPPLFQLETIWNLANRVISQAWYLVLALVIAIALLVYSQFWLRAIAVILSLIFGWVLSHNWEKIVLYSHSTPFNSTEPLLGKDIGFYIFYLPVWELLAFWLVGLCLYGFIAVLLTYLLSGDSLSQGVFPGFSPPQKRHLFGLGGCLMLVVAFSYWLSRYKLVYSPRGVSFGASYTDAKIQLPAETMLCVLAVAIAFYLLWQTLFWKSKSRHHRWIIYAVSIYLGLIVIGDFIVPAVVQYLIVQPNELQREQPYIQRTIALTRQAFNLEVINSQTFNPQGKLTQADLRANDLTIRNIRLWDQEPLLKTNRQLQQIRPYYQFPDADIDRYQITTQSQSTEKQQVLIAARELDYNAVPQQAKTWVNRNLIYTHGYGFTMSPVNKVAPGGLPEYFVKDISSNGSVLTTSSEAIRESIPIQEPRIYYGEITNTHVMTGTKVKELDYPSGSENVYNTYDGRGGIRIGSLWRRWLFATYLKDWQMVFTRNFLPETKVLFRRNINQRIRAIAPFLKFDGEPYLVAADANHDNKNLQFPGAKNYLYWIVDAYTISDHYPYSDRGRDGINYIRNSVKIVIDAYNGTVRFYIAEPKDPLIVSWSKIFPQMFQPLAAMPANLRSHIRYPVDFFKIQSERLMVYHMTDAQVFYNREDQWQIPNEIYGTQTRPVEPYYLTTSLPNVAFEEFILLIPYTPKQRTNLIAWLAARSDGENYGKLLLYNFPKERLIYGPEQIEARINQDPVISQQISLWNRQGSSAIQGNLLIVPIEQSLLYVEPIYLEATQNSLPTLVRVVVAYENRIVMAQTLEQALQAIFQSDLTPAPAIIRPVEEEGIPPG
ncbi:UPF0182 family protein [Trichormus variabilis]|uniref:UPF0182 protein DSM107003_02650 n=1 Tax=Trichormus variabilis SAG 1403-4b TaxID=447716 RepID=A0A433V0R8_ANAVA|nr:UPF0182 family protein [Trichormus variabilis]MBD2625309.1 UPF0182 family protein [Trichormus variabilis FACHB-164]RUS99681.1 UPF0182 protein [Trichormus variabilis SAG 1403-4b]